MANGNLAWVGSAKDDDLGMDRALAIADVELNNGGTEVFICRGDGSDWALRVWREAKAQRKAEVSGTQIPAHVRSMEHMD
jgi:hypothetical protein